MIVVGGADEAVVGDVHQLPQVLDALGTLHDAVHELLGRHAGLRGLILDFLAVLVGAGQEHDIVTGQALVAGHGVGGHGAVGVADVQLVRGIVDGGGDIKLFLFHGVFSFPTAAPNGRGPVFNHVLFYYTDFFRKLQCFQTFLPWLFYRGGPGCSGTDEKMRKSAGIAGTLS